MQTKHLNFVENRGICIEGHEVQTTLQLFVQHEKIALPETAESESNRRSAGAWNFVFVFM
jgi:hypothetical protein